MPLHVVLPPLVVASREVARDFLLGHVVLPRVLAVVGPEVPVEVAGLAAPGLAAADGAPTASGVVVEVFAKNKGSFVVSYYYIYISG